MVILKKVIFFFAMVLVYYFNVFASKYLHAEKKNISHQNILASNYKKKIKINLF